MNQPNLLCDTRDCTMTGNCLFIFSHSTEVQGSNAVNNINNALSYKLLYNMRY